MRTLATLLAVLCAGVAAAQQPVVRLHIAQVDPPSGSRLGVGDTVYVRVLYDTNVEILILGRGQRDGAALDKLRGRIQPSPAYAAGTGEALVWLSFDEAARMDELRVDAVPARGAGQPAATASAQLALEWSPGVARRPRPAWVEPLLAQANQRVLARAGEQSGDSFLTLFVMLLFASMPAYLVVQGYAFWHFRGRLGPAVWLPAALMGAVFAFVLVTGLAGSNLSPIWLVFTCPFALAWIAVLIGRDLWRGRAR